MRRTSRVTRRIADGCCDRILLQLCQFDRRALFCAFLDYAIRRGSPKAEGYAANLFKDIFGTWPQSRDRGPPAPLPNHFNHVIGEWVADRKKRDRKTRRVIRIEKAAPLIDRVTEESPLLDEHGFVKGTLMRPTADDYYYQWK